MKAFLLIGTFGILLLSAAYLLLTLANKDTDTISTLSASNPFKPDLAQIQELKVRGDGNSLAQAVHGIFLLNEPEVKELLKKLDVNQLSMLETSSFRCVYACFQKLASIDPIMALKETAALEYEVKEVALDAILAEWVLLDTDAAVNYAVNLQDSSERGSLLQKLLGQLAQNAPRQAFQLAVDYDQSDEAKLKILSYLSQTEPELALERIDQLSRAYRNQARYQIMEQWIRRTPEDALLYVRQSGDQDLMFATVRIQTALDKSLAALSSSKAQFAEDEIRRIVIEFARSNPQAALDWVAAELQGKLAEQITYAIISSWSPADINAAMEYYESTYDLKLKRMLANSILKALVKSESPEFIERLNSLGDMGNFQSLVKQFFSNVSEKDVEYALELADELKNRTYRTAALETALKAYTKQAPSAALAFTETLNSSEFSESARGAVFKELAQSSPQVVFEYFQQSETSRIGDFEIEDFIGIVTKNDTQLAQSYVEQVEDPLFRDRALSTFITTWGNEDPLSAAAYAFSLEEPTEAVIRSTWRLGPKLAARAPKSALELALSQPKTTQSQSLIDNMIGVWAKRDPRAALTALAAIPEARLNHTQHRVIAAALANKPVQAKEWIARIPDEGHRSTAISHFVSGWVETNPLEASQWVNDMDRGKTRDEGIRALVNVFVDAEPEYAMQWADVMSDANQRNNLIKKTYDGWKNRAPNAAQAWLETTKMLEAEQKSQF